MKKNAIGLGVRQAKWKVIEREYHIGDYVTVKIKPPEDQIEWVQRKGIFEGFSVWQGIIYVVLRRDSMPNPYLLIPLSRFAKTTLDRLGGVRASAIEELRGSKPDLVYKDEWSNDAPKRRALQTTLICTRCKINKTVQEFSNHPNTKTGYQSQCKVCVRIGIDERKFSKAA